MKGGESGGGGEEKYRHGRKAGGGEFRLRGIGEV